MRKGESIGRQLRGVAAFLSPTPTATAVEQETPSDKFVGIRNGLVEIDGSFKTGLSLLSDSKVVTEISRFASSFLLFTRDQDHRSDHDDDYDEDDDEASRINEDVIEFVKKISNRPELWTDFPLSLDQDFNMFENQKEDAENIEHLVPNFEALKVKLEQNLGDDEVLECCYSETTTSDCFSVFYIKHSWRLLGDDIADHGKWTKRFRCDRNLHSKDIMRSGQSGLDVIVFCTRKMLVLSSLTYVCAT